MKKIIQVFPEGDFNKLINIFKGYHEKSKVDEDVLDKYGRRGVEILEAYTPKRTGLTSRSWYYKIIREKNSAELAFYNSNIQNGVNIAILIQFGHLTRSGYWVSGRNYIDPAVIPVLEDLAREAWEEVVNE